MSEKKKSTRAQSLLQIALFAGILIFINIVANARFEGKALYTYLDLTEEKRFSLTPGTKNLLHEIKSEVHVRVLLEGDFPAGFKRLQTAIRDLLEDLRSESGYIEYTFDDPTLGDAATVKERQKILADQGVLPTALRLKDANSTSKQLIYPYAIIEHRGRNWSVNLLENETPGRSNEVVLNNSIGLLEYKLTNTIAKLRNTKAPVILFTKGHGELTPYETADLEKTLHEYYQLGRVNLDSVITIGEKADILIVAKPQTPFSDKDKFKIDQYVMNGGKVLWFLDKVSVSLDSLQGRKEYYPSPYDLNLDDLLFRYGIRLQTNLLMDLQSSSIPLASGYVGNAPQLELYRYPYHIVASPTSTHPAVKSLGPVNLFYANSIDESVKTKTGLKKTTLLSTSQKTRYQRLPVAMNFEFLRYELDPKNFDKGSQAVAVLLEGNFSSLYENKISNEMLNTLSSVGVEFKKESASNKMIIVSDGDVLKNGVKKDGQTYSPLGWNQFDKYKFANKEFVTNLIEYMIDKEGLIAARGKDIKLRMLDSSKAQAETQKWQLINLVLPLVFLAIFGFAFNWIRRMRFGKQA